MDDCNRHREPAMQMGIAPKQVLHRAKGLLTSTGKSILAVQHTAQLAVPDASLDVCTRNLDDHKNGSLGGFLKTKAKSLRSKSPSQAARYNRKDDGSHSESRSQVTTGSTPSSSGSSLSQKEQLAVFATPSSMQCMAEQSSMADLDVPLLLREGVQMTKVSLGKQKSYKFKLDPDQGRIIWQSKKLRIIPVENVKELRFSSDARYYRQQFQLAQDYEDRWITIIYILNGVYKTLHLIASTREIFQMWSIALKKLYAIRQELMTGLGNEETRRAIWEKHYWSASDESSNQKLQFDEVERLCRRLNLTNTTEELMRLFKQADTKCQGFLDFSDFHSFVKLLRARPEINILYKKLCSRNNGRFDFSVFEHFMHDTQKSKLSHPQLMQLFMHYAKHMDHETLSSDVSPTLLPSLSQVSALLSPSLPTPPLSDAALSQPFTTPPHELVMSLDGFSTFLLSSDNSAFVDQLGKVWHDMTRPLSDYFISSSHNTYLTGHQLVGSSTIEGYIRALLHSCRSVELDIYDGDTEPMVFHGKTFTSKVSVREVCEAIMKYAFVISPYPIIISAEIHCSVLQQEMMVMIMHDIFGDALVSAPVEGRPKFEVLPSPEQLKGRVLLKAKNLCISVSEPTGSKDVNVNTESSSVELSTDSDVFHETRDKETKSRAIEMGASNDSKGNFKSGRSIFDRVRRYSPKTPGTAAPYMSGTSPHTTIPKSSESRTVHKDKMSPSVAGLLVYTVGVKCRGINKKEHYAPEHMFSLSEKTANKVIKQGMIDLVKHTRTHMVRIYPKGLRVNSSNYLPYPYWAAGAQLVAINWQTFDLGYMINHAMFQRNGRAGYVLKPLALRTSDKELLSRHTQHSLEITVISAQQLPLPKDSLGREIMDKSAMDPYVEVSIHVPDWAYIQSSTSATSPPSSTGRSVSRRTNAVKSNGFNPVWQETLNLPFDCVGGMLDLIFVRFAVRRDGDNDEEPIAVYCVSLGSLAMGYRHLPLHDTQLSQYLFSTLFVMCAIN